MPVTGTTLAEEARARAYATPLEDFQPHAVGHFTSDTLWPWFERLRAEDPVHFTAASEYGPYWSITRYADIVTCESDWARLSSAAKHGGITLFEPPEGSDPEQRSDERASFISLDPPRHDDQRRAVSPMFSTPSLAELEPLIRSRAAAILDELPIDEEFDFVDRVAIELTSQMLATLFDFPFEHRRLLPRFSDYLLSPVADTPEESQRQQTEMFTSLQRFVPLWNDRRGAARRNDLISLLANDPATDGGGNPQNYMGNIILLIVAGSDTTRHSITGGLIALNRYPDEYAKLRANPALLEAAAPEIIRWQYWVTGNNGDARRDESTVRLTSRATQIDPSYARAWVLMALAQSSMRTLFAGKGDGGLAAAERALTLDPDLAEAHAVRADIWLRSGHQDEAAAEIAIALRLDPESYEVNNSAAGLCFDQRQLEDAIRYWEKAAALMETDYGSPAMLVTCYVAIGDDAAARRAAQLCLARAEAAVAQDRSNGKALGFGGNALAVLGETERAKEWTERALLLDPDNMVMRYNFACGFARHARDVDAAVTMLGPVVEQATPEFLAHVKVDPDLDPIRDDTRFQALIAGAEARLAKAPG